MERTEFGLRPSVFVLCGLGIGASLAAGCTPDVPRPGPTLQSKQALEPVCDPAAAFGSISRVLPTSVTAEGFALGPDGRTAIITNRSGGNYDLFLATRPGTTGPFDWFSRLTGSINGPADERAPWLSANGHRLYFHRQGIVGSSDLFVADRTGLDQPFGMPSPVSGANGPSFDEDPFLISSEQRLYFTSHRGSSVDLFVASLADGQISTLSGLNSDEPEGRPVISSDERRIYFKSRRPGVYSDMDGDIFFAQRASTADPFVNPTNVSALNTGGIDFPVWLSADGCDLYFASNREALTRTTDGGLEVFHLYRGRRHAVPSQVTITVHVVGSGTVGAPFNCSASGGTCSITRTFGQSLVVFANSAGYWTGVCEPNGARLSSDGILPFTLDGTCTVDFTTGVNCAAPLDDGNPCTVDSCHPVQGVVHAPAPAGTSCADIDVCNGAETCNGSGVCTAGAPPNVDDSNPCTIDTCSQNGILHQPVSTGTPCADANLCNGTETCNASGACIAGTPVTCAASDVCRLVSVCDPSTGACSNEAKPNGTSCNDETVCNGAEICQAGSCVPGSPLVVDDGNPCTIDSCNPVSGVSHSATPDGSLCLDGNVCNGLETCNNGQCQAGTPPVIDDGNLCTVDSCSPVHGVTHAANAAGTSCSDGIACNGTEVCDATGVCQGGSGSCGECVPGSTTFGCTPNTCQNRSLRVVDVQADFRDIWAGREIKEIGKRTGSLPTVELRFNQPVDPTRVLARMVGHVGAGSTDCTLDPPVELHQTALRAVIGGTESWATAMNGSAQRVPLDFGVVSFGDLTGMQYSESAVAVAGNATLTGFEINGVAQRSSGLVVRGLLDASNGTIRGDFHYGKRTPILSSVGVTGSQTNGLSVDFDALRGRLLALSETLGARSAIGSYELGASGLTLKGHDPVLNVFSLPAEALAQGGSKTIFVPPGSAVLVNIRGESVSIPDGAVELSGASPGSVLWNLPSARAVAFGNVDFKGSLLAVSALVTFTGGDFRGTLVAGSVTGPARFRNHTLSNWSTFGTASALTTKVVLRPDSHLRAGCAYSMRVDASFPASPAGICLSAPLQVDFLTATADSSASGRELIVLRQEPRGESPYSFEAQTGVNTLVEEVFDRYGSDLGLRAGVDRLVRFGTPGESPFAAGTQTAFFRQLYLGVPVDGFGYLAQHQEGIFRSATGGVLTGFDLPIEPAISSTQAIAAALAHVDLATRPWEDSPPGGPPPQAELLIVSARTPGVPAPRLVWRVRFSGVREVSAVDVDARTAQIVASQPGVKAQTLPPIECANFNPQNSTPFGYLTTDATIAFSSSSSLERPDLTVGLWEQNGTTFEVLNNLEPFVHRVHYVKADSQANLSSIFNVCLHPEDPVGAKAITVHWGLQAAARSFSDYKFSDAPWLGLRGVDDGIPLSTFLVDPPLDDPGSHTVYHPFRTDLGVERIEVDIRAAYAPRVSHEFAHGVLASARRRASLDPLQYTSTESGALEEAFSDMMAAAATSKAGGEPWCWPAMGVPYCERDMADPKASRGFAGACPDTYLGDEWEDTTDPCSADNDYCFVHNNSTVAGHWFYTIVNGRDDETENDLDCANEVDPLDDDPVVAMQKAGQIALTAFSAMPSNANFLAARSATADAARALYGRDEELIIDEAWHAVGVGPEPNPQGISPRNGAADVEPWQTEFRWEVDDQAGPWTLLYSTHSDFSDPEERVVESATVIDGKRYARAFLGLTPAKRYYWKAREGLPGSSVPWNDCTAFQATFKTAEKRIKLLSPAETQDGLYLTDPYGFIEWELVEGARGYDVFFSPAPSSCAWQQDPTPVLSFFGQLQPVVLGDSLHPGGEGFIGWDDPVFIAPDWDFGPDDVDYLYIRARFSDGNHGGCAEFPVRKTQLMPFEILSPLADQNGLPTVPFDSGGPFVWTPSEGAERYEVRLSRWAPGGTAVEFVTSETVEAADLELIDGHYEYTLLDRTATTIPGQFYLDVYAYSGQFRRRAWDPGRPLNRNDAQFWTGAEQPSEAWLFGPAAEGMDGRCQTVDTWLTECTVVFPALNEEGDLDRTVEFCSLLRGNTAGALWWLGTEQAYNEGIDPADIHDEWAHINQTPECLGPQEVYLPEDDMILILKPYSVKTGDTPQGYGSDHVYRFRGGTCGAVGTPCCIEGPGSVDDYCAGLGSKCVDGFCEACGRYGEPPCDDGRCLREDEPLFPDAQGICRQCGLSSSQPCCPYEVFGRNCWRDFNWGWSHICVEGPDECDPEDCGYEGGPCCSGECPDAPGATCQGGKCLTPAPEMLGLPCDTPIDVSGGNERGTYEIDMGQERGQFWLYVNTLEVPDAITVRVGGEGGEIIAGPYCFGSMLFENECSVYDVTRPDPQWCCNGPGYLGYCRSQIGFTGNRLVSIEIEPNCSGTDETLWTFTAFCPSSR